MAAAGVALLLLVGASAQTVIYTGDCTVTSLSPQLPDVSFDAPFASTFTNQGVAVVLDEVTTGPSSETSRLLFSTAGFPFALLLNLASSATIVIATPSGQLYVTEPTQVTVVNSVNRPTTSVLASGFISLSGITRDPVSGVVYVTDFGAHAVFSIAPGATAQAPTVVTRLAGGGGPLALGAGAIDGVGAAAAFNDPFGLAFDAPRSRLVVSDYANNLVRAIALPSGAVTTIAGSIFLANTTTRGTDDGPTNSGNNDGPATSALFCNPDGITVDTSGNIFISDFCNNAIRVITPAGSVATLAGGPGGDNAGIINGAGSVARFNAPSGLTLGPSGTLVVADSLNAALRYLVCPAFTSASPSPSPIPAPAAPADGGLGGPAVAGGLSAAVWGLLVGVIVAAAVVGTLSGVFCCRPAAGSMPPPMFKAAPPVAMELSPRRGGKNGSPSASDAYAPTTPGGSAPPLPGVASESDPTGVAMPPRGSVRIVANPLEAALAAPGGAAGGTREWA